MRHPALFTVALSLVACGPKLPEIVRDLPSNYAEGQQVFSSRLKTRFPIGSQEGNLIEILRNDGFEVADSHHDRFATISDKGFPIANVWHVGWQAEGGRITKIWGIYGGRGP